MQSTAAVLLLHPTLPFATNQVQEEMDAPSPPQGALNIPKKRRWYMFGVAWSR